MEDQTEVEDRREPEETYTNVTATPVPVYGQPDTTEVQDATGR
jgi:hypothetical protein